MKVQQQRQINEVTSEVQALTAVVRPVLTGVLYAIKKDVVREVGGYENVKLKMLPRLYREGDGDCGICFEYAVHEAIMGGDGRVLERVADAMRLCRLRGGSLTSLLFGLEKNGSQQLVDTAFETLTNESQLLYGKQGRPVKLRKHLNNVASNFRKRKTPLPLPQSINGLWKTDLFIGEGEGDRWIATTVKINPAQIQGAAGIRIGIVPVREGASDKVRVDDARNLVICPLHHDHDFMEVFYSGWRIVQAFIDADAKVPAEVALPRPDHREVARILAERREYPIVDVVEALSIFAQKGLIESSDRTVDLQALRGSVSTGMLIAPISRGVK